MSMSVQEGRCPICDGELIGGNMRGHHCPPGVLAGKNAADAAANNDGNGPLFGGARPVGERIADGFAMLDDDGVS